jgi:enoyl-[acyl-carrier protein] reductase I
VENMLEGKTGLVVGVANKRSLAWAIAERLAGAGARIALTYQNERVEKGVRDLAGGLPNPGPCVELDVSDDTALGAAVSSVAADLGGIDILVHAVAFADADDLGGRYVDTKRAGFGMALDISSFSLTALARAVEPHMRQRGGGSIMSLSYIAGERAVPGYNVMGVAKAALESMTRYLAWDLGDGNIRVNAISAGPVRTLAARGIPGFLDMTDRAVARSPLRREISASEVADAALFLASPLSSAVTGHVLYVDAGFHAMGM